jgi:hypothetical protein
MTDDSRTDEVQTAGRLPAGRSGSLSVGLEDIVRGIPPTLLTALAWALVVIPALATLAYINRYGVNGPYWDHLTSADLFEQWHDGTFTLEHLFRPHNEHRKAVDRLVVLGLGSLTRFNNLAEMNLQWALLCSTVAILFVAFRRDARLLASRTHALLLFLPMAWLLLSVRQYEILLVGDGLLTYLSLIFFVASIALLAFGRDSIGALAGAVFCGLLTSFSQSNGLLVWPIGFLLLLADARSRPDRRPVLRLATWTVCGIATIGGYFHGYQDPGNHPVPGFVLQHPAPALAHILAVGGGSLSPEMRGAVAAGALLLLLEMTIGLILAIEWWRDRERPPFGLWLIVCAVATQVMISLNRAGFGVGQGLSPRYATYSSLAPIGLYWCTIARRDRWRLAQPLALVLATLMAMGFLSGSLDGLTQGRKWNVDRKWRAYLLYTAKYQPSSLLAKDLYSNPDHARLYATALERLGLNVFAEEHVRPERLIATTVRPQFMIEQVNGAPPNPTVPIVVSGDDVIRVTGWALDASKRPLPALFVSVDGTLDIPGHIGIDKPEVTAAAGTRRAKWCGFVTTFSASLLTPGEHILTVKFVSEDKVHAFVTDPVARVVHK